MAPTCTAARVYIFVLVVFAVNTSFDSVDSCRNTERELRASFYCIDGRNTSRNLLFRRWIISSSSLLATAAVKPSWRPTANRRLKYCKSRVPYYNNSDSTFNLLLDTSRLLLISGDIEIKPGPTTTSTSSSQNSQSPINLNIEHQHNGDQYHHQPGNNRIKYTLSLIHISEPTRRT